MSDSEDEQYVYSDEEDGGDGWGDAAMAESPGAKKAREDDAGPARVEDGASVLMGADEVAKMMLAKVRQISELLDVPRDCAEVLLRQKGWSPERLTEQYWADGEKLRKAAGLEKWTWPDGERSSVTLPAAAGTVTCRICFDEVPADKARAAPCGHSFCDECYSGYLDNAVQEGSSCVLAPCPEQECSTAVPLKLWEQMLEKERFERLRRFRLENFVSFSKDLRWCPGVGCSKVVRSGSSVSSVKCQVSQGGCGAAICVRCGEEAHQPASCPVMAEWDEKCQNESETANWILANTKRCPKCTTRIEKNQGCNHMSCSQCKYEFCWMCMGDWTEHGATTGGFYKCNKFDPNADNEDDGSDAAKAKRELDRYLHYYKRYAGHDQAQKFAVKQLEQTEKRMMELQETTSGSWIDVQFLKAANEMVIDCRRVLKYTYVFGYYLVAQDKAKMKELFENLQEHLEKFTEQLSEMTELPVDQMDRTEIVNVTRVTESFLVNLIKGTESGLDVPVEPPVPPPVAAK